MPHKPDKLLSDVLAAAAAIRGNRGCDVIMVAMDELTKTP
jgi:hypothetical protein